MMVESRFDNLTDNHFIQGLLLLAKYGKLQSIFTGHEVILVGFEDIGSMDDIRSEDRLSLEKIRGWHWSNEHDCLACFV